MRNFVHSCALVLLAALFIGSPVSAQCSSTDLDAGSTVVAGSVSIQGYANQAGWNNYAWPSNTQLFCEPGPDDWRLYWRHSFVANPANSGTIRLRYQGPHAACQLTSYWGDYLSDASGPYLRIQTSSQAGPFWNRVTCDASDYVIVWP